MAFKRTAGGHAFNFSTDTCDKCGISRKRFEDTGEPGCTGKKPEKEQPTEMDID